MNDESLPSINLLLTRLDPGLALPSYAHSDDAGADLATRDDLVIHPGERVLAPTGIAVAIPKGFVGLVHPRSGLATKYGLSVVNAPGTIDAGYRGEIKVNLINLDPTHQINLKRGDLIAQLLIQPVLRANFIEVDELPASERGQDGHGSTGGIQDS